MRLEARFYHPLMMRYRVSAQELEFQETLIAEREAEIREIETGIHELNDIFRDLGTIVEQQGGLIGQLST